MTYIFFLGNHPALSRVEVERVLAQYNIAASFRQDGKRLWVFTDEQINAKEIMTALGGTISIAEHITDAPHLTKDVVDYLDNVTDGKIHFSLHTKNRRLGVEVKKLLKQKGRSVRYIEPKNTATILHNDLVNKETDVSIIDSKLFVTRAVQPIEDFSDRDYGRPGRDDKSGMLPPKLARMMINLAGGKNIHTLLDPYCGSGTVLMEGALLGIPHIIGSDLSSKAITDTKKNIAWMIEERLITPEQQDIFTVMEADVQEIDQHIDPCSVEAVVFEPYMGKPLSGREGRDVLLKQTQELKRLYVSAFRSLHKVLQDDATIVCIIPQFRYRNEWVTISCIKEITQQGFTVTPFTPKHRSLLYWREGQHVGRMIWQFKKL